jgi:hypothetical protein
LELHNFFQSLNDPRFFFGCKNNQVAIFWSFVEVWQVIEDFEQKLSHKKKFRFLI